MLAGVKFVPRDQLISRKVSSDCDSEDGDDKRRSQKSKKDKKLRKSKKDRRRKRDYDDSDDYSEDDDDDFENRKRKRRDKGKSLATADSSDEAGEVVQQKDNEVTRKEMGLEWMLSAGKKNESECIKIENEQKETQQEEEVTKVNPRELNPYLKDKGSGYPSEDAGTSAHQHLTTSVIGDGGASWRLKALKRAKEQAAREGRKLNEVVEERWGSLGQLAASVTVRGVAPVHAHLLASRDRKKGQIDEPENVSDVHRARRETRRDYLQDVSLRRHDMKKPKNDSLTWRKNRGQVSRDISSEDASLLSSTISSLNTFTNDGSFMDEIARQQSKFERSEIDVPLKKEGSDQLCSVDSQASSANQLAAKIMQLRMKGKHEEADSLSKELEARTEKHDTGSKIIREDTYGSAHRYMQKKASSEQKRREDDADLHLAGKIMQNKQYSLSGRADDEYDFGDDAPSRKRNRKKEGKSEEPRNVPRRFMTQQERCQLCFDNPSRPKHLVLAIANFTYLMLPQWQPVVQGHCCILTMQHEPSVRTVDNNVWEEIRNFKKCLIMMFSKQEKDVVFLETVIGLSQQRRHCIIECIPVPFEIAKQAPLYFKKAIDEAEDEWSQHEMKKLIPTSGNLRHVIPENFPYFHVEFGLDRGFVHVIDDDSNFKSGFGLNVIRGLLRLPEEDMYRRRKQVSMEKQMQDVASFASDWEHFDWTKQLD